MDEKQSGAFGCITTFENIVDPEQLASLVFPSAPKKGTVKFPGKGHFKRVTKG